MRQQSECCAAAFSRAWHAWLDPRTANKLSVLSRVLENSLAQAFAPLSSSGAALLLTLQNHGPQTATALGRTIGLTQSAAARLADRLAEEGFVSRAAEKQGREVLLLLTGVQSFTFFIISGSKEVRLVRLRRNRMS